MAPPLIHYQYNNRKEIQSFGVPIVVHIMSSGLRILLFNTTDNNNASGVCGHYGGCGSRGVAGDVAASVGEYRYFHHNNKHKHHNLQIQQLEIIVV